ncbi:hypothetical protein M0R45_008013 [Rubus argutus]|uniref:E3 ubiquitin-protein ligase RMA n=1 Tax=Rubus argutus TaxID=59490 RepID=A0AAW1Y392_RUBAR
MDGGDEGCGFECNICLTLAQDPVITLCGHLYCWSCLIKWLFNSPYSNNECPLKNLLSHSVATSIVGLVSINGFPKWNSDSNCWVCKAAIEENKLIPLYGKGITCSSDDDSDSRSRAVVPAGIAGSLASTTKVNRFVRGSFDATGTLFRVWKICHGDFHDKGVTNSCNSFDVSSLDAKGKETRFGGEGFRIEFVVFMILVIWDILSGKIRRHTKLEH